MRGSQYLLCLRSAKRIVDFRLVDATALYTGQTFNRTMNSIFLTEQRPPHECSLESRHKQRQHELTSAAAASGSSTSRESLPPSSDQRNNRVKMSVEQLIAENAMVIVTAGG
ncbi:hypothetical protein RDI58_028305 [Solanum bulbocastanum]|uniref:Uncharacterized protein n=1 Tax=Solanum bulbocastanum TaxID=147425 RepID=A0AAN8XZD3_SOLBU